MTERNYLIYDEIAQKPEVKALFDKAVQQILSDQPPGLNKHYPKGFMVDKQKLMGSSVLEYWLRSQPLADFQLQPTLDFVERTRVLLGWDEIGYELRLWVEENLCHPFFENQGNDWNKQWVLKPGALPANVPDGAFRFACQIAVNHLKYGPSYASVTANEIFDWVTQLGSKLPEQLKKHGSGDLPKELAQWKGRGASATANDALAVIRINQKEENEQAYGEVLDYLLRLLTSTDFPRSYAIEYRGPTKTYLPIKGLPKKGVHQLFACAAAYPALHGRIAAYARAAMREFEWYQNLEDEDCAMPGSFAVFALALADGQADQRFAPLTLEYLHLADGEHQSLHGKFVEAYIEAHGFTEAGVAYLHACVGNIQHLAHRKTYPALMANARSLQWLLTARRQHQNDAPSATLALRANLEGRRETPLAYRELLEVIWGSTVVKEGGKKLMGSAPEELRPLYEQIFA